MFPEIEPRTVYVNRIFRYRGRLTAVTIAGSNSAGPVGDSGLPYVTADFFDADGRRRPG
jgi:hypothetical protein